jgi:hypothetical protein
MGKDKDSEKALKKVYELDDRIAEKFDKSI